METSDFIQDLVVRGESIEQVYSYFNEKRYIVNRRYQRKLVWTNAEKINFVDSVLKGYPVPIFLLAEDRRVEGNRFEIIDGMQRLNALMSFIENDYQIVDGYFDLNAMAFTKLLLDKGQLTQSEPVLDREKCVAIARYSLPLSIFEYVDPLGVDEVFRRINSGGKQLSRQELRAAGAVGHFAQVVRRIAAKVRGDDSKSDIVLLNDIAKISIVDRESQIGIPADQVFWVKHGILTREQVRGSRDEELVSDIVAFMVSTDPPPARSEFLDSWFGLRDDESGKARLREIELAVQRRSPEFVISDFIRVFDQFCSLFDEDLTFGKLVFDAQPAQAPRRFQAVFLAFFALVVQKGMVVGNKDKLLGTMKKEKDKISAQEGGNWGAEARKNTVNSLVGIYGPYFIPAKSSDPANVHWISQLQNLFSQSFTEQNCYDFKQGFLRVDSSKSFDEGSFVKMMKTCVGIANLKKGDKGYVVIGVADNKDTAKKIEKLYGVKATEFSTFLVTGTDHEAAALAKSKDQFFQMIVEKVKSSKMSEPLRSFVTSNIKSVRYFDKNVYVLEVCGQDDPSNFDGMFFVREGAQLKEVAPTQLASFLRKYIAN